MAVALIVLIATITNFTVAFAQNIPDPTRPTGWSDSYSVNGQCYCDTNFDHGLSSVTVLTNNGRKTVPEVCATIRSTFGNGPQQGRLYFNTVQCGHGPVNNAADETVCPGIPRASGNFTGNRCFETGATWNLDQLYPGDSSPSETSSSTQAPAIEAPSIETIGSDQGPDAFEVPESEIPVLVFDICASSASDPDGDGFGFENNESCIVDTDAGTDPTVPSVQTLAGPTPEISVPAGTPGFAICSSIDSDPDGDGFGFENNLTCIVDTDAGVDPATPLIQTPAEPTPDVSAAQTTEAGEESAPDALQQPQQSDLPIDSCAATTPNTSFNRTTDLIVLHFDFGRDPDDGHAAVADRVLLDHFAIQNYWVVSGTNSRWQNNFIDTSDTLTDSLFGQGGWQKANILNDNTWMQAIAASALRWSETLSNGGDLWIAEGGPADFTSAVLRSIESTVRDCNWEARIHVIQHSATNETNTGRLLDDQRTDDLAYVRANTDYHKIDDGNAPNGTADLHANNATTAQNSAFIDLALSGASRVEWQAGFQFLGPGTDSNAPVGNSGGKLDFSDTVELLHILQVPTTQVSDWNDFALSLIHI